MHQSALIMLYNFLINFSASVSVCLNSKSLQTVSDKKCEDNTLISEIKASA